MDNYYKEMEPSAATASGNLPAADQTNDYQKKVKKSKSIPDGGASRSWSFSDPESRRKRRVAGYKVYSVEQKMKGSIRKKLQMVQRHYQYFLKIDSPLSFFLFIYKKYMNLFLLSVC